MKRWVEGEGLSFDLSEAGLLPSIDFTSERLYVQDLLLPQTGLITTTNSTDESFYLARPLEAA